MRSTQQFSITLPNEMAEAARAKVAAGQYATESEVIRDGLRVLPARDEAVEDWLRKNVAAAYDALKVNRSRAVAVGVVKTRLAAAHTKASKKIPIKACSSTLPSAGPRRWPTATPALWWRLASVWRSFRCAACRAITSAPAYA